MILKQQHICKMKAERNFYIIQKADTMIFLNKYSAIIKKKKEQKNKRQTMMFLLCALIQLH
jgi:hypothetical protein